MAKTDVHQKEEKWPKIKIIKKTMAEVHEKRTNRSALKTELNPKQATERSAMKQGKQRIVSKTEQLQYCGNKIHSSTIRAEQTEVC